MYLIDYIKDKMDSNGNIGKYSFRVTFIDENDVYIDSIEKLKEYRHYNISIYKKNTKLGVFTNNVSTDSYKEYIVEFMKETDRTLKIEEFLK